MCSISDCPERVLLDSLSNSKFYRSGYLAYTYFLPIFAKNNWALVKQFPKQNGYFRTTVTKHGTVMDIIYNNLYGEFHAIVLNKERRRYEHCWDKESRRYEHCWELDSNKHVRWWTTSTDIESGTNYRNWIDSLVKFIKG
jgi:hypothetical protein